MSGNPITEHMFPLCSIRYILNFHITHLPYRHSYHPLTTISPTTPPIFPPQSANSLRIFRQFVSSHFLCNMHKNFCTKNLKNTLFSPWFQGKKYIRKTPDYKQKLPKNFKFSTIFLDFKRKKVISRNLIDFTTRHLKITLFLHVPNIIFNSNIQLKLTNNSLIKLPSGHHYFTLHPFILH